jgi:hypothetical protein
MTLIISKGLTLDNGTRAAAIAGVSPTLDYRFAREKREIETVSLTDKLTYTGGNGTFVGSDGFIQPATTNVPRFDHDPLSRQSLGLLSEVSGVNLKTNSESLIAGFTQQNTTVTADSATAPDGKLAADLSVPNTASASHASFNIGITFVTSTVYTWSIFAKPSGYSNLQLLFTSGFNNANIWANFVLEGTGSTGFQGTGATASIQRFANDWYRCIITGTAGASATTGGPVVIALDSNRNDRNPGFPGDGTSGIYLWGAQLEAASTPSTYIPTTDAAVTRTADSAVIDGTGVITGTYTMVEKPAGCAVVSGTNINLQPGFTAERVMVFPAALDAGQITAIRGAM